MRQRNPDTHGHVGAFPHAFPDGEPRSHQHSHSYPGFADSDGGASSNCHCCSHPHPGISGNTNRDQFVQDGFGGDRVRFHDPLVG